MARRVALPDQVFQITTSKANTVFAVLEHSSGVSGYLLGTFHIYGGKTNVLVELPATHVCH